MAFSAALTFATLPGGLAQEPSPLPVFAIGYVHLETDPRQVERNVYYQIPVAPLGRSVVGAEVAIIDSEFLGRQLGVDFRLEVARNDNLDALALIIERWLESGIHFVVADLPPAELLWLSDAVADLPVTIFNISAADDVLRGASCRANVIHSVPSNRMRTDALAQFLVQHRWTDVLVLRGPLDEDRAMVEALTASAGLFGLDIVDVRDYFVTADPRNPTLGNVRLLTDGVDYDVIFIADAAGEFAATVAYGTARPQLVIGSAGLVPTAWHWSWDRAGAAQLNANFQFLADRRMGSADWAAWVSVRAVVQSVLRAGSTDYTDLLRFLLSTDMSLDGAKGPPLSVRAWDHQLRQPILLANYNYVVARAPLDGFVDPVNNLDTLGVTAAFSECRL